MLKPPSLMPSETDADDIKHSKRLALFSHMCQRRQRLCTTSKKKDYTWAIEASMGVEVSSDQRTLFSPSTTDVNVGNLMREVAIDSGVKKKATRKLNNLGEINPKCNMLNHPDRLVKMKNMLQLGASIESLTTITNKERTNKKQVLVGKLLEHVAHARLKLARFPTVTVDCGISKQLENDRSESHTNEGSARSLRGITKEKNRTCRSFSAGL